MAKWILKARVVSHSHNSPCDADGHHWPKGQEFKMLPKSKQIWRNRVGMEQIGGEEVIVLFSQEQIDSLFN